MRYLSRLLILLAVSLVGCKSPQFTAKTKSDLSKLCVYEFPYTPLPLKTERDTIVINNVVIKRDSIDCTDKIGIQYVEVEVPSDTVYINTTKFVKDSAQMVYILELEHKLEKSNEALKEAIKHRNWSVGILLIMGGVLIYRFIK